MKTKNEKEKKLKFYRNCKFCTESSYWSLRWGKQRKAAKVGLALWGTDVSLLVHEELGEWLKQSWDSDLRGKSCRFLDASVSKSMWCTGSRNDRETESYLQQLEQIVFARRKNHGRGGGNKRKLTKMSKPRIFNPSPVIQSLSSTLYWQNLKWSQLVKETFGLLSRH